MTEETTEVFNEFRNGWANKNMEVAWYQLAKSVKATGDGAFVGFLDKGEFGWKVLSFLNGDKLFPHYDLRTGKLSTFARTYCNYAEDGSVTKRYIDVWDDTYYYRFVADGDPKNLLEKAKQLIFKLFSTDGYKLEWSESQDSDHFFMENMVRVEDEMIIAGTLPSCKDIIGPYFLESDSSFRCGSLPNM